MKKAIGVLLAVVLMPVSQVQAWIGGPFSNNSFFPNGDDGIYEAFATIKNGMGLYRFGVRNNGVTAETAAGPVNGLIGSNVMFNGGLIQAQSSNVWYFRGVVYIGACVGTANSDAGIVSAIGNAESNTPVSNPSSGTGVNGITFVGPEGGNIQFANSSWVASISQKFPIVRFAGKGTVTFVGQADQITDDFDFDPPVTSQDIDVQVQINGTGGESGAFSQVGHKKTMRVYGNRVSTVVSP